MADAARPAAATAADQQRDVLLGLLLEHPAIGSDQAVLRSLLSSSKHARALAARHSAGRVDVRVNVTSVPEAESLGAWLRRHAALLRSLALRPLFAGDDTHAASAAAWEALATALRQAEQLAPGSLSRLRSFSCRGPHAPPQPVLEALAPAAGSLTRLEVHRPGCIREPALCGAAIARLTSLRDLELQAMGDYVCADANEAALLPQLTRLSVSNVAIREDVDFARLSATLEHLELPVRWPGYGLGPDLTHLTRLTELKLRRTGIFVRSKLPPSLQRLTTGPLRSLEPLRRLTALTRLQCTSFSERIIELRRDLPDLGDVCLWRDLETSEATGDEDSLQAISEHPTARAAIRGLQETHVGRVPSTVLRPRLMRLTSLTTLHFAIFMWGEEYDLFAEALRALPQLRELDLSDVVMGADETAAHAGGDDFMIAAAAVANSRGGTDAGDAMLLRVVTELPALRAFGCWALTSGASIHELTAAVRLTSLGLANCAVSAADIVPVLAALTGLEHLDLPEDFTGEAEGWVDALCGMTGLSSLNAAGISLEQDAAGLRRLWQSLHRLSDIHFDC